MRFDTQKLIIQLLQEERKRANHLSTLFYKEEIDEALRDFISFVNRNPRILTKDT